MFEDLHLAYQKDNQNFANITLLAEIREFTFQINHQKRLTRKAKKLKQEFIKETE